MVEERVEVTTAIQWRGNRDHNGDRRSQPPLLQPRLPIHQQGDYGDQNSTVRTRLLSNKRTRSYDRDEEEEEHQSRRY